jgi:beta-lactamase family protein
LRGDGSPQASPSYCGRPVYLRRFGVRDVATKALMIKDTIFRLYSMSKQITAVAVMMLVEQGKRSLTDPLSRYIPAFADVKVGVERDGADGKPVLVIVPPDRPITIADLLRHGKGPAYRATTCSLMRWAARRPFKLQSGLRDRVHRTTSAFCLERFPAKWIPVRVKKTRQNKEIEPRFDSIETEKALRRRILLRIRGVGVVEVVACAIRDA